jgi:hypothetical protein
LTSETRPNQRNSDAEAPLFFLSKKRDPKSGRRVDRRSAYCFSGPPDGRCTFIPSNMVRAASSMVRWHGLTFLGVCNENTNLAGDRFDFGSMLELIYQF